MNRSTPFAALLDDDGSLWLTDGGLETVMVFLEGLDLPQFAAFPLLETAQGRDALTRYFAGILDLAADLGVGTVLDTATWRASHGWGRAMGLDAGATDRGNRDAVAFAGRLRDARPGQKIVISGVVGPHGDAYAPAATLTAEAAQSYHGAQIDVLAQAGVDMITGVTLGSAGEALGIARAAQASGLPVALSFTVETDGQMIDGRPLRDAIAEVDRATGGYPVWFGINCAHPDHFRAVLAGPWVNRIGSVRANASRKSHAELDEATELDDGNPMELAAQYAELRHLLPGLRVVGGCCGTDLRHISAIGHACVGHATRI